MVPLDPKRTFQNNGGVISVTSDEEFPYKQGVGAVLFQKMSELEKEIAQIDAITGEIDTYRALLQRCVRTAITMRSKGITPGDIITICSSNHLNTCVPLIASFFLGTKFANTDPSLSLSDTAFLLNQVRPKMVFVSPNGVKLIEHALQQIGITAEIVVFGETSKHSRFSDFLMAQPGEEQFEPVEVADLKETAVIFFSSGTTGFPKGICVTHMSLLAQTLEARKAHGTPASVLLVYSTAYWISLTVCLLITVASGGCRLVVPNFDPIAIWNLIEKYKVSLAILSPAQVAQICQNGRPEGANTSSLMVCAAGGSPTSKEQIVTMRSMLPGSLVVTGYGQTEVGGGATAFKLTSPEDIKLALEKPTSCGRPTPGFLYKVVDPETEEVLGPNQQGEIRIKTEFEMNGYYNVDSSNAWDSDGFIRTGDIGYYDEDYCFYIVDRIKEMLKFQSWQIAPALLEAVLMAHPAVECAAVIGLPDPVDGDHPMGVVTLGKSYAGTITAEEIQKYVDERVSDKQKLRGGVKIVESIPVTPTGKFRRKYMRDLVLAGKM